MAVPTVTVTGSLYSAVTGEKITSGQLIIKLASAIPFGDGVLTPVAARITVPSSGNLNFTLVGRLATKYLVEFDPFPSDIFTPASLKPGYFRNEWTLTNLSPVTFSTLTGSGTLTPIGGPLP